MKLNPPPPRNIRKEHYGSLDGMRACAAIGIVMMHVLTNIEIKPTANYLTQTVIPFFTNFVFLFMMISAFCVSCGYYERIKTKQITPEVFFKKRYKRVLPFFAIMVLVDVAWERNVRALLEGFVDLTLCFGLYPNANISVIGVGWFIGLVFLFYMLFPFFVFLLDNKRRAWITFVASLALSLIGIYYFASSIYFEHSMDFGRTNIIYSSPFFVVGGMAYLYRLKIVQFVRLHELLMLAFCCIVTVVVFVAMKFYNSFIMLTLILFTSWLLYGVGSKNIVLNNRIIRYISGISMEIYLCHMLFFRATSFVHLEKYVSSPNLLYGLTLVCTLLGAIIFSHICKFYVIEKIKCLK